MHNDELKPVAISVREAARMLGVSPPTLYGLIRDQRFPAFKIGARTLISVAGLKAWVEQQATA